jgi:glycerophosphoryl diester phosphodiesterase
MARSLLALLATFAGIRGARAQCTCPGEDTEVIGHRGTGADRSDNAFPENTIASFLQAAVEGATMVELDVQRTGDGQLVVMHDDTVDRTTDGSGCVAELSSAAMEALSAGGERVPTLIDVFEAVDLALNIEIKVSEEDGCPATDRPALAAELARVMALYPGRRVVVSSFDLDQLLAVRAVDDSIQLAFLFTNPDGFAVAREQSMDAHPLVLAATEAAIQAHRDAGFAVRPYTINDRPSMRRMLGFGVDGIVTDTPDVLVETKADFCAAYCEPPAAGVDGGTGGASGGGCAAGGGRSLGLLGLLFARLRGGSSRGRRRRSPPR